MTRRISPMEASDLDSVLALENICFFAPWRKSDFVTELSSPITINRVSKAADPNGEELVIGYSCSQLVIDELNLLKIAVSPEWRCKGVGFQLLNHVIEVAVQKGAVKVFLEVRPSNPGAIALYRNSGFEIIGKRLKYYTETGEDALVMTKKLDN